MYRHTPTVDVFGNFVSSLKKCKVVAIHGPSFSGKSHLAKELSALIRGTHVEIDAIPSVPNPSKIYLDHVNFPEIEKLIRNGLPPVIVDCYVVLDILDRIKIKADILIECNRSSAICGIATDLDSDFESYVKRHDAKPDWSFMLEKI